MILATHDDPEAVAEMFAADFDEVPPSSTVTPNNTTSTEQDQ